MTTATQQRNAPADLERMARQLHLLDLYLIEQGRVRPCSDDNYSRVALDYVMAEHGLCKHKQR
ncbi:hypothetical protein GIW79_22845 [Pseudomonas sp. PA-7-1E]|mgnify:CR=1 FL=1|uniref:hypothetical protein n=1 Tax=Gammaproteobacteria TaxID=1236 RepID=UPI00193249DB|nr:MULTISPECIES: hypothetical protein [Gammaproteobacteria]MBM0557868.1 hypothetical protein [Escherichia coli]MCF4988345.1 hypothetical protein [Pseudomonas gessardii]MCF5043290.1 hypothetical protein [Pseudomonas sp. PA-7-1E]MCF5131269.1 hypothetical protein [Pseudomonas sp. PA-6-4F]